MVHTSPVLGRMRSLLKEGREAKKYHSQEKLVAEGLMDVSMEMEENANNGVNGDTPLLHQNGGKTATTKY
ncbi:hypothetical protein V6N12_024424 [Hibiscus sabdariffa]|uniref:Uncharacterized protein n=1 Tax=Hibiscus sabdariffa TaxID=183260 RepID=A0ABR2G0K1_9ROSI